MRAITKAQDGFTIQELLVAMNVGFLLVSFCLTLFFSAGKMLASWQTRLSLKQAVQGVLYRMALEAQHATTIEVSGDSVITMKATMRSHAWQLQGTWVSVNSEVIRLDRSVVLQVTRKDRGLHVHAKGSFGGSGYMQNILLEAQPDAKSLFRAQQSNSRR